ncbi:hypothetical protein L6452_12027 [Arctium lappa]|uniref:Uncharacterized protein n=1 Tax=Arctium lappa TaxID=4217 RepID=A0ACB9DQA6_ARCLA|nr:hypothetical protein L6452_12027 [Arctium lappa]
MVVVVEHRLQSLRDNWGPWLTIGGSDSSNGVDVAGQVSGASFSHESEYDLAAMCVCGITDETKTVASSNGGSCQIFLQTELHAIPSLEIPRVSAIQMALSLSKTYQP